MTADKSKEFALACSLKRGRIKPEAFKFQPEDLRAYLRSKPDVVDSILRQAPDDTRDHTQYAYVHHRPAGGYEVGRFDGVTREVSFRHERQDAAADFVLAFWGVDRLERPITGQILEAFRFLVLDYGFTVTWRCEHFLSCFMTFRRDDLKVTVEYEGLSHNCDVFFERVRHGVRQQYKSLAEVLLQKGFDPFAPQANMKNAGEKIRWIAEQTSEFVLSVSSGDPFTGVLAKE